ncbi:hypothetical protein BKA60DRAFT_156739 [Fusarium oxysporum]|nr:hypothetical protein BKA60DRAFT_156739 [Fusarium oxysporum]
MLSRVRPPVDAHPMAEMPQCLINAPCCMMEDGAISDSPPEPGRVAQEASGTNLLPDWSTQRVARVKRLITGRSTGPESPIPCLGVAKTTRCLGGRSLISSC